MLSLCGEVFPAASPEGCNKGLSHTGLCAEVVSGLGESLASCIGQHARDNTACVSFQTFGLTKGCLGWLVMKRCKQLCSGWLK